MSLTSSTLLPAVRPWLNAPRWWLGYSGGLDSTVLLHLLVQLSQQQRLPPLRALHINHQLQPDAQRWSEHCAAVCAGLGVALDCQTVTVGAIGDGPEAAARAARYDCFAAQLQAGELLLLGHHLDDQVETFFLRLLRGAGTHGLQGMPATRPLGSGSLLRPLLGCSRAELENYAERQGLQWIEDDSNQNQALDRNYLRHAVLPRIGERWPAYRASIEQAMAALAEAELQLADRDAQLLTAASGVYFAEPVLDLKLLQGCTAAVLARVLRLWLQRLGRQLPGRRPLQELVRQLQTAQPGAGPGLQLGEWRLQRFQQRLHLYRPSCAKPGATKLRLLPGQVLAVPGLGKLEMRAVAAGGVRLPEQGYWQLAWRQGGERCQPQGRKHSQSLKKLLQEYAVPPWQRELVPLLYDGSELLAVGDLWTCEGGQPSPGQHGYQLVQHPLSL